MIYALDSPINEHGGPEHVRRLVEGEHSAPANYRFTVDNGISIVYHVCGRGPKVVFGSSPGWGVGLNYLPSSFQPMIESGEVTFVVMQTRGSSPSDRPKDETKMGSGHMADDLNALRRHLGFESVTVFGHSNAGAIAISYAQNYPLHCAGLVVADTQVFGLGSVGRSVVDELQKRKDDPRYAAAVQFFFDNNAGGVMMDPLAMVKSDEHLTGLISGILSLYFYDPATSMPIFVNAFGELNVQHWAYIYQGIADRKLDADAMKHLHKIKAPCLLFSGEDDWICSVEGSRAVADGIGPHAKHVVYPKCGHVPFIEKKEEFFEELMLFISKLQPTESLQ